LSERPADPPVTPCRRRYHRAGNRLSLSYSGDCRLC
jgi:hypothetical protein